MRHTARIALLTLLLPLLLALGILPIAAEESEASQPQEKLPAEYVTWLESIPEELREYLPEGLFSEDPACVAAALDEMSDASYLLRAVLGAVGLHLEECGALLASVCGLLLLSALSSTLSSSLGGEGVARAFSLCSTLTVTLAILAGAYRSIASVTRYFANLSAFTAASLPLVATLYLMGGNAGAAAASSAGLSAHMALLEGVIGKSILPFCGICMALALLGAIDPSLRTGTLLATVKRSYTTLLGLLMTLLHAMLGTQHLLGVKGDSVAMRGVKFAAGNLIPVVGGSVAELIRTVSAGVGFLRGIVGISGILLLLLMLLPTLTELWLLRLCWQLCASLADLLGCQCEKRLTEELASVLGYLITAVCICSSVFLLALTLLSRCAAAIG